MEELDLFGFELGLLPSEEFLLVAGGFGEGVEHLHHVAIVQQLHDAGVDIQVTKDRTTRFVEENLIAVKQAYTEADARFTDYPLSSDDPDD